MIRWIHLRISRMNPYFVQNRNGITKIGLDYTTGLRLEWSI